MSGEEKKDKTVIFQSTNKEFMVQTFLLKKLLKNYLKILQKTVHLCSYNEMRHRHGYIS